MIAGRAERWLLGLPLHSWAGDRGCSSLERRGHRSSAPSGLLLPVPKRW